MIDVIDNISAYFDDDMVNIIYKDLKSNGLLVFFFSED